MTLAGIDNPDSPLVARALAWSCECGAKTGELCRNTIRKGEPLPGRVVHYARLVDRRRKPKADT